MKKMLVATVFSFLLGVALFSFIPQQIKIEASGDIPILSKRDLINNASVVIRGTVDKILPSSWSNPDFAKGLEVRNTIQTDVLIKVNEVYKNKPYDNSVVTVRIEAGKVGNTTLTSEGYPTFQPGEEVVLFLSEDDGDLANPNENYYVLTGMLQGKFSLNEKTSTDKTFVNKSDNDLLNGKDSFKLSTIGEEINSTLKDLKLKPIQKLTKEEIRIQNEKVFGK
ncbi:hypothetical protein [Paenibacillus wynnii]|uniref:hypothetical protein n=1 Tax=Paenibacillus wynnii TaxID=268407 RepID=UPI0027929234|nr:hypothetical protein [Paenibacillus wynnii]MDQ0194906.1 hypothetical protein [Paenibacillus wynnii]